jgi:hypothetical protein
MLLWIGFAAILHAPEPFSKAVEAEQIELSKTSIDLLNKEGLCD